MVWVLSLSDWDLSTPTLTAVLKMGGIRSSSGFGRMRLPLVLSVALPPPTIHNAAPKGISESTSYFPV